MIGISIANSLGFTGPSVLPDASSQAYFAATGITGVTQQAAINNLVKGLKTDGIWSKMKAVYPFVTDNRNLLSYTEDFSNAYWSKNNVTITSNSITAPNGTLTADKINETSGTINPLVTNNTVAYTVGQTYTLSVYAKAAERNYAFVDLYLNGVDNAILVDLTNGNIVNTLGTATNTSVTSFDNGWYRISISILASSISSASISFGCKNSTNWGSYTGTAGSGIYAWGAQLELGSTATTYQPIATTQQAYIAAQFKYNLVNPVDSDAAFRLVFNGGWTHSSNGATPNGTNGYADTKFVPSSVLTLNSNHISYYSRTNANVGTDMGVQSDDVIGRTLYMAARNSLGNLVASITNLDANRISSSNADSTGFYVASRISDTSLKSYKNSLLQATNTTAGISSQANAVLAIGCLAYKPNTLPVTFISYSTKQVAFSTIGDGLTDTDAANLYTRVQAYQTALSRNV